MGEDQRKNKPPGTPPRINIPAGKPLQRSRWWTYGFILIFAVFILFLMPMPYVIFQPGSAETVRPMVHVENGYPEEKGALMLTTVRMNYANLAGTLLAIGNPHAEIVRKADIFREGESGEDYAQRQQVYMMTSQSDAIQAAYKKAGIPYRIVSEGVIVLKVEEGMPAEGVLASGDQLLQIDGRRIQTVDDLLSYLETKSAGNTVNVLYKRNGKEQQASVRLAELSGTEGPPRPGMGVFLAEVQKVQPADGKHQVEISAGEIGGPSAGLMFALEIYNQLVPEDITKGYRIAGTGMIDPEGRVDVIGGIRHKVVAAHREGAEIFFSPPDWYPPKGSPGQPVLNATEAKETARELETPMKIVVVRTLDEALEYLRKLPPKVSGGDPAKAAVHQTPGNKAAGSAERGISGPFNGGW